MTEQTSRLVIEISSEQAKKNAEELSKELVKIFTGGEKASDSTSKLGKTIQVTSNITQNFNTTVNNTTKAVEKQTQELAKQEKQVDKTGVAIKTLAGHLAAFITINSTIDKMDSYTGLQNRLKLVTNSQTELNRAMNDTFAIAQNTRQSWESAAQVYQGFANNAKALGLSMSDTARLTETVSKAVAISGSSAQASEAALIQFNQALSSGTLRGEELNSVMEQTPGLAKAIAEGMGITVGQLRSVAATGSITSAELVKALTKAKASVDNLFSKTDITIGQSITLLNNELGKFVGEAGQSSGAAKTLADAIQLLSQNLGPLADGAMVVGIGYLTKSFLDKAVATRTAIAASAQHQTSMLAEQAATVELTGVEALRARQNVVLAAQEVRSAELALVNAKSKDAQAIATQRLAAAEVAHNVALKESTIATAQYTLAQDALNKSKALGSKLLTAIGGPIGALTLAAMGLAAGYTYLQKRTDDANKKLAEQTEVANKTKEELLALQGVQKNGAKSDLEDAFKGQNKELKELNSLFNAHVIDLQNAYKGNVEIVEISNKVRQGVLSQEDAIKALNKLDFISPEQLKQLQKDNDLYREKLPVVQKVQEALKVFGIDAELAGNKASNSAKGFNDITKEAILTSDKVKNLSAEIQKFISSSLTSSMQNEERLKLYNQGLSKESADIILKAREAAGILGTDKQLPLGTLALLGRELLTTTEIKKVEEERSKSEKDRTKELEKQIKTQQRLIGISGNSGIGTGAHLDVRYGGSRDGQKVSPEHIARLQAGGKSLSSYRVSSDYGQRKAPTAGASSFHKGIDFAMPVGTPITTKVAVKDVKTAYDSKGGGYYSTVTFEDGVVLKLLHQSPSMQSKVKGGASTGTYGSYLAQDKAEAKTEKEIETLRANYYSLGEKDEADHIKRVKDLRKNGLDSLIADENTRFEKTKQLRQFEFTMEVDGWRWVGEEKIKNDAYVKKLRVEASTDFNKKEKAEAIKSFEEQRDFELAAYRRLQLDKLNEFKASLEQQTGELQRAYLDTLAQNRMSKPQLAMWQFQNQFKGSINTAYDSYEQSVKEINKKDDKDQYLIVAEKRNAMLIAAEKNLQAQLLLIKAKGVEDEKALRKVQFEDQLSMWGGILSTGQNTFSQLAQSAKDGLGEQSSTYRTMFAMQQAFSVASSMVAAWTAYTTAFADPSAMTLTQKFAGGAAVMAALMPALTTIGSISMQGFATGGLVRGPGSGTSDSIPAYLSNGEHVATAWAVNRIGVANYDYMNRTGELPFQREYEALKSQFTMPNSTDAPKRFAEGGIVGAYNPDFERKQFEAISRSNQQTQVQQPQTVENVVKVIMVKDEEEAKEHLYGKDGEKAWLYHLNRNKSKVR
ncbi:tape measure protein [Acinetobacter bereziniae]|uniref:tape measure protein n=1 Tax=Acinetobacter bereziniae TaxID=106648 RepID=UPI00125F66C6|nr:tape measure protein [Acinetobacter bereziniae]